MLYGKRITAGLTGGIAAYKAAELVSWLKKQGAEVSVAMTKAATEFITPLTLKTLSGRPVTVDLMDVNTDWQVPHIDLADCDLFLLVPATANILAKAALGLADDLLSAAHKACHGKLHGVILTQIKLHARACASPILSRIQKGNVGLLALSVCRHADVAF